MKRRILLLAALLLPAVAHAHPGHADAGLASGFMHPFSGLDHVVAMLAVGAWAARNAGMRRWLTPAAFLAGMMAGGALGLGGFLPSFLESAVTASAFAAALLVLLAVRLPLGLQTSIAAAFAIWHGIAHGAELPAAAAPLDFAVGFLTATGVLLALGLALGRLLQRSERDRWLGAGLSVLAASLFWS
ncbi:MAG: HupE/UreJ family protein [Thiobacillus sp.]